MQTTTVLEYAKRWGVSESTARLRLEQKVKEGVARKRIEMRKVQHQLPTSFPATRITVYTLLEGAQ